MERKINNANKSPIIRVTSAHSVESTKSVGGQTASMSATTPDQFAAPTSSSSASNRDWNSNNNDEDEQSKYYNNNNGNGNGNEQNARQQGVTFERIPLEANKQAAAISSITTSAVSPTTTSVTTTTTTTSKTANPLASKNANNEATHAYTMRWFVLAIFCSHSAINSFQWIQYAIITNIVTEYYQVSSQLVNLTSMVYMITYIPFIIHASLMLERVGLRSAICLGAAGTAIGSLVKLQFGSAPTPHAFWGMMVGQTIVALSQLYIISIPPLLAAVWFPDHQVSTATGIGVFGNQLGIALGCIIPPLLVSGHLAPREQIGNELYALSLWVALISLAICLLAFACLKDKPPKPPGSASLHAEHQHKEHLEAAAAAATTAGCSNDSNKRNNSNNQDSGMETFASIKELGQDRDFKLLTISYGINVGVFYAISTVLNQMLAKRWPSPDDLSGTMGLLLVVSGMAGSVMCGQLLDRTHAYKLIIVLIYLLSLVSMLMFTLVLRMFTGTWPLYVASTTLGFFMTGYLPLGFEFAAEITYPHPANTPAGLLNLSAQVFGLALTYVSSLLVDIDFGDLWANIFLTGCLGVGLLLTVVMKANLKRQKAVAEEHMKI